MWASHVSSMTFLSSRSNTTCSMTWYTTDQTALCSLLNCFVERHPVLLRPSCPSRLRLISSRRTSPLVWCCLHFPRSGFRFEDSHVPPFPHHSQHRPPLLTSFCFHLSTPPPMTRSVCRRSRPSSLCRITGYGMGVKRLLGWQLTETRRFSSMTSGSYSFVASVILRLRLVVDKSR